MTERDRGNRDRHRPLPYARRGGSIAGESARPTRRRHPVPAVGVLAICALVLVPVLATASGGTAGEFQSAIASISKLVKREVRPPTTRLSGSLPADSERVSRLREPAVTAQEQLSIALGELRQMSTLTLDPHYAPALIAVGRAFMAVSGQDPLTRTAVSPEYQGLPTEIAAESGRLARSAREAEAASKAVRKLTAQLAAARRRASSVTARAGRVQPGAGGKAPRG